MELASCKDTSNIVDESAVVPSTNTSYPNHRTPCKVRDEPCVWLACGVSRFHGREAERVRAAPDARWTSEH